MRRVIVNEFMSLDGVAQAPGAADEDTSGGFEHGGWHLGYFDDISQKWVVESLTQAGGFLLGRRTYEIFAAYWPNVEHDLVDEFRMMIDPLLLGGGKRFFRDDGVRRPLRLVDGQVTTTGAIIATYAPADQA
jgi:dihydrofolate reductase